MPSRGAWRIGVDVGGTFTDAVGVAQDGTTEVAKVRSTPDRPEEALAQALHELAGRGVELKRTTLLVYGSTVATNALIQDRLARVVLVTTEGFRDVLAIGTGMRRDLYDLWAPKREPLVDRADRLEARQRTGAQGEAVVALSGKEVRRLVGAVARRDPQSIAVVFLFSYAEPGPERQLGVALERALPAVPITLSSDVVREFREYPRTHTTVVAAALRPIVARHLSRAVEAAHEAGVAAPVRVMLSNGGMGTPQRATTAPHQLVLSGPAGGVAGAVALAARVGVRDLISLDMGGTSVDVCLIRDGQPPTTSFQSFRGEPIMAPAIDMVSAGAGGGSIARIEAGVSLKVGPDSAGAEPGPAAYGRGGEEPTVTDAHLVLGHLGESTPLAGRLDLHLELAERAVARVARPLRLGLDEAAEGILAVTTAHLARAVRRVSIERGRDPRGLTLIAFGGAGPLHAAALLRELRLGRVVVPPHPGLGSAIGLLDADVRVDLSQTVLARLDRVQPAELLAWFRESARALRERLAADGIPVDRRRLMASVDCRYVGQGYELSVSLPRVDTRGIAALPRSFHELHRQTYGGASPEEPVEAVTLRLAGFGAVERSGRAPTRRGHGRGQPPDAARLADRSVRLPELGRRAPVACWRRDGLRAGDRLAGPCIVEEMDSTTLILAGMEGRVGPLGELHIREAA